MGVDTYNVTITSRSSDSWHVVFTWAHQTPSEDFQHLAWRAPHFQGTSGGSNTQTFSFSTTYQAALIQEYLGIGGVYKDITIKQAKLQDNFNVNYDAQQGRYNLNDGVTSSSLPDNALGITNTTSRNDFAIGLGIDGKAAQMIKPKVNALSLFHTDLHFYCLLIPDHTKISQILSSTVFTDAKSIDLNTMVGRNININIETDNIWTIDAK